MFTCREKLSNEQLNSIKTIIHTDDFKKINSIVNICDLEQSEDKIIQNVKDYIWLFISNSHSSLFNVDVNNFIDFFKNYSNNKKPVFTYPSENGEIKDLRYDFLVICNGYHIKHDYSYMHGGSVNGLYMAESYLGTDHKIYLSKRSMRVRALPVSDEAKMEVDYNSLLAESVFRYFSQPVASYYLGKRIVTPYNIILTPNFLDSNQELIHLSDLPNNNDKYPFTHTGRLNMIIDCLTDRYKKNMTDTEFNKLIEKIQLQFCIQSFLKLLIGPVDINSGNTALVLTHNGTSVPSIDISPAYDLDISFNVSYELDDGDNLSQLRDANGKFSTIMSLVKEFKDIPGFKDFLTKFVKTKLKHNIAKEVLDDVYKRTNLSFFREKETSYTHFLNQRFIEVLEAYKTVYAKEDVNETNLGR